MMKKYMLLSVFGMLSSFSYFIATDSQDNGLTVTEKKCYDWFVETQKKYQLSPFQKLSQEDREVFNKGILYTDNPQAVTQSRHHFAESFCKLAEEAKIPLMCDQATLKDLFLKMAITMQQKGINNPKNEVEVRMWLFSQLPAEERIKWTEEYYLKNSDETKKALLNFSKSVSDDLAKRGMIENTDIAKEQKAQEIYKEKLQVFELNYKKNK
jgi:hypothetical protein